MRYIEHASSIPDRMMCISQPEKSTSFPPASTWQEYKGVRWGACDVAGF